MQVKCRWVTVLKLLGTILGHLGWLDFCRGQTPSDTIRLFKDKMGSDVYNAKVRPAYDQSVPTHVNVTFTLLSILDLSDVKQQFHCNGFLEISWRDELLTWDPADYGGQILIHPLAQEIWRPRVLLQNTLDDRDIFKDDNAPLITHFSGKTVWLPGSLFSVSCDLDMTNYPYDRQTCYIQLLSMGLGVDEVNFEVTNRKVDSTLFSPHDEWELLEGWVANVGFVDGDRSMPGITITFKMKRRASFLLLNVILPVVFLSFMSLLVFVIPEESGEKLSYGITVLLALTVYLSIISSMLPRSSDNLPLVNMYIFSLLIISLLIVIDSIVIVFVSYKQQKEESCMPMKENLRHPVKKVTNARTAVHPLNLTNPNVSTTSKLSSMTSEVEWDKTDGPTVSTYKAIGKRVNAISLLFFSLIWIAVTFGFGMMISTSD